MITLKLSTKTNGIVYKDISVEKVLELTQANVGTNGPRKITIEWAINDKDVAVVKPIEAANEASVTQPEVIPTPAPEKKNKTSDIPPDGIDEHKDLVVLSEIGRIDKYDFTTAKYIPLESNLSYAETEDGRMSIKYAGNKINTTWEELIVTGVAASVYPPTSPSGQDFG